MWVPDMFLIVVGQQLRSMAQTNKLHQLKATHTIGHLLVGLSWELLPIRKI